MTKLQRLKDHMVAGEHRQALKLAASFPQLGAHKEDITRGWSAIQSPNFYYDIGQDPEQLVQQGLTAIRERYDL